MSESVDQELNYIGFVETEGEEFIIGTQPSDDKEGGRVEIPDDVTSKDVARLSKASKRPSANQIQALVKNRQVSFSNVSGSRPASQSMSSNGTYQQSKTSILE